MQASRDDIEALNDITKILIDGSALYQKAGELADDANASTAIADVTSERRALCSEFQNQVRTLGGDPADDGTVLGASHKGFMSLRSLVDNDTKTAVSEVERGEDYLRDEIKKRLEDKTLSPQVQAFLNDALSRIRSGHDRISALKRQYN
ncbi:MAG: PA2169 family four-helix-bundle protein [Phycisphaerales bacterium]|nr:PA2169 family four-helix-bundle protein [Hyphomonadaceae bacterium]